MRKITGIIWITIANLLLGGLNAYLGYVKHQDVFPNQSDGLEVFLHFIIYFVCLILFLIFNKSQSNKKEIDAVFKEQEKEEINNG